MFKRGQKMMKYEEVEIEIITFEDADVIVTSNPNGVPEESV